MNELFEVKLPPEIARLQAKAQRLSTYLDESVTGEGAGQMVWHCWTPSAGVARKSLPLVMLHGGSGSWTHWLRAIEPLTQAGYTLYLPDLPGFGDSDAVPDGSDVDTMLGPLASGITQLLGAAQTGPVCDLVGFSFGGMASGLLAAQSPQLMRRLVIVGAPAVGVIEGKAVRLKGWRHFSTQQAQNEAHRYNLAALMLHDASLIDEETLALHVLNVQRDRLPRRRLAQTDILAQALAKVQCPVAAIYGEHDPLYLGRMQELQQVLQRQTAGKVHWQMVNDAGHWVQHEKPQQLVQALLAALAEG